MNNTKIQPINITLGQEVHTKVKHFAAQQDSTQKGKQVYLNALAIYAVHNYLKWLQIDSDFQNSDSWQPGIQSISNTADLLIPQVGRLECCPVLPQEIHLTILPQATEARIGYVAVQFAENLEQVQLIGFFPPVAPTRESQQIPLTKLQSLELLLKIISEPVAVEVTKPKSKIAVNLGKWWSGVFEPGWISAEALFEGNFLRTSMALRGATQEERAENDEPVFPIKVRRGKLIDLGVRLGHDLVALLVTCTPTTQAEIDILIQVYPGAELIYLPANLELKVLDETETLISELQATARNADNCIQLLFTGDPGEKFSVTLTLGEISFAESFQI